MKSPRAKFLACLLAALPCAHALGAPAPSEEGAPYADRLIRPEALWVDPDAICEETPYDFSGPSRGMRLELVKTMLNRNGRNTREDGITFGLWRETEGYGTWSVEGALRDGGNGILSIWQRNLAFDGGWRANNGFGILGMPGIDLLRHQYRFFVPSATMQGLSTEWLNGSSTQFTAGIGEPVQYDGIRVPSFTKLPGTVFSAGAQTALAPGWDAGIQVVGANDVRPNSTADLSTTGMLASAVWKDKDLRIHANVIVVDSNLDGFHRGGWVDAEFRGLEVDHHVGFFRLDPGLHWGNQPIASDMEGAYYRANFQSRQWQWDGGADYVAPVSGSHPGTLYATGNARYQISRDWGTGAGMNVQRGLSDAWSLFAFMDRQSNLGSTRAQINHAQDDTRRGTQLAIDHSWHLNESLRMSTGLSLQHENDGQGAFNNVGVNLYGGGPIGNQLSLDTNIQLYSRSGADGGSSTFINLALNWRIAQHWTLSTFAYDNDTNDWRPLAVNSPIVNPALIPIQRAQDRGVFFTLRYDFSAGGSYVPLGGAPGEGGGQVTGMLYYDQNDNGRMDAGERGIPNITIIMDGRFVTRTDTSGRFEFPQVRAGHHDIAAQQDMLPLPWKLRGEGRQEFDVKVRDAATVDIGAVQMR